MDDTHPALTELYAPHVATRARLEGDAGLGVLFGARVDPALFERFLIQLASQGAQLAEATTAWLQRAGERCLALGQDEIGCAFLLRARRERGRHLTLVQDTRHLVRGWNARRGPTLDTDDLLTQPSTPALRAYVGVHEAAIAGEAPAGEAAIAYEVERAVLALGPRLVTQCRRLLGEDVVGGLRFVTVAASAGAPSGHLVAEVLAGDPSQARALALAGARGLAAWLDFLQECVASAVEALAPPQSLSAAS